MRRMSRVLVIAWIALLVATTRSSAAEPTAKIIQYGRYSTAPLGAVPTEQEVSGGVFIQGTVPMHFRTTRRIPCAIGEDFGFTVALSGLEPGREYKISQVSLHPPIKQPDGRVLKKSSSEQTVTAPAEEAGFHAGWCFAEGYEYELIPGRWTISVSIDGQAPVEMTFDVVPPDAADEPDTGSKA
jgi:hypothetical protein